MQAVLDRLVVMERSMEEMERSNDDMARSMEEMERANDNMAKSMEGMERSMEEMKIENRRFVNIGEEMNQDIET